MIEPRETAFDAAAFLANSGLGRRIVQFKPKQLLFSQGDPADSIFHLQRGRAKLTVVSAAGKEATITLLTVGDFVGEESIAAVGGLRLATATAITACTALKIERREIIRVLHEEHAFSDLFLKFLLARSMRTQADLIDQLFNSSEKRLANPPAAGGVWQAGRTGTVDSGDHAANFGGNDRDHPVQSQLLHESLSQTRLY